MKINFNGVINIDIYDEIINLILIEFENILRNLNKFYNKEEKEIIGYPPKQAIVIHHDEYDITGSKVGRTISTWLLFLDDIEFTDDKVSKLMNKQARRFFEEGIFLFSINEDIDKAILEWQVGPCFGKGSLYTIQNRNNELKLIKNEDLWEF